MQQMDFSSLSNRDLIDLGIQTKELQFVPGGIQTLCNLDAGTEECISLSTQLKEIYDHVDMEVRAKYASTWRLY